MVSVAVVLTGAGTRAFCSGGNTREYAEVYAGAPGEYRQYMRLFNDMVTTVFWSSLSWASDARAKSSDWAVINSVSADGENVSGSSRISFSMRCVRCSRLNASMRAFRAIV